MKEPITVRVYHIVGGSHCVASEDGERIYGKIRPLLEKDTPVDLSFEGIETMNTAFLNAAIGQLFASFEEEHVRGLLSYTHLNEEGYRVVQVVIQNALIYFSNIDEYDRAWLEIMGDEDDEEAEQ